jgi:hypothetical protein
VKRLSVGSTRNPFTAVPCSGTRTSRCRRRHPSFLALSSARPDRPVVGLHRRTFVSRAESSRVAIRLHGARRAWGGRGRFRPAVNEVKWAQWAMGSAAPPAPVALSPLAPWLGVSVISENEQHVAFCIIIGAGPIQVPPSRVVVPVARKPSPLPSYS